MAANTTDRIIESDEPSEHNVVFYICSKCKAAHCHMPFQIVTRPASLVSLCPVRNMKNPSDSIPATAGQKGVFPFLSLPAELRLKIYSYVCDHKFMSVPPRGRIASILNFNDAFHLARISSQIRNEALPHVFSKVVLLIEWETLHRYIYTNLPELAAHAVTAVRIVSFPVNGLPAISLPAGYQTYEKFYPSSLATFFPSLRSLRVVLKSDECLSKSISGPMPWYWGHDEFTANEVLKVPGLKWIRRNKGIRKLTFKAYNLCWMCSKLDGVDDVLDEVSRRIKQDVEAR